MPYRTKAVLEDWLQEFPAYGSELLGHVALQDGSDGSDTGLVIVRLQNAPTGVFMQPVGRGDPRWEVTFEARLEDLSMDADRVAALARELELASRLCRHFEAKSREHDREVAAAETP
ncbi:hypothetical protein ACTU3I_07960 [Microbacterium sp. RD1]|uniref:hypothetical protein n=1 Tax=Microbacterium sp. RD1 TaxID=3457313 RepID=UPI003FA60116